MKSFKLLLVLLILVLLSTSLMAGGAKEAKEEVINLTFWFGRADFVPRDEFKQFHADNPNIKVEWDVVPLEQAHTDFMRNHSAGSAPDVVQIFGEFVATMVAQETLLDISDYLEDWKKEAPADYADVFDIAFDMTSYRDGIWGLNVHSGPFFLGYRKDWIEQAGLQPPKTWEDVIEISRVLQKTVLTEGQYAFAQPGGAHHPPFWMNSIFMSMGGQFKETGTPIIDSPAGIALIKFYQTLAREGLQDPEAPSWASGDFRGAFMGGRAAFFPEAINVFALTQKQLEYGKQWEVMVQPPRAGAEADHRVNSFGWPFMVNSDTKHPEAVMKALRYIFDQNIVTGVAYSYQPANRASVLGSAEYTKSHPYFPILQQSFAEQVPYPTHLRSPERSDILNQMKQIAQTQLNRTAEDIAKEYQTKLDALDK